jgi:hypothetical protein
MHLTLPHFETLRFEDFLEYANQNPNVLEYLPIERETYRLPRQFLINTIYSVINTPFKKWADTRIEARNNKIRREKNLNVNMTAAAAECFASSNHVTSKCQSRFSPSSFF